LPPGWQRLCFRLIWHGARVRVDVRRDEVTYTASHAPDEGVEIMHAGETLLLLPETPVSRPVEYVTPMTPRPTQPVGREPMGRDTLE
jgi:trehalose/maltose hydrolase-like predicted phosphorylase